MPKISVKDLAKRMGIPSQDLIFKLKSIGVRVDEENADLDAGVLQAIMEGKKLPHPREVILRDKEAQKTAVQRRRRPRRRLGPAPVRPSRRRTLVQKVEPRIKTIPVTERPAAPPTPPPEPARPTPPPTEAKPAAKTPDKAPAPSATTAAPAEEATSRGTTEEAPPPSPPPAAAVEDSRSRRSRRRAERKERAAAGDGVASFQEGAPEGPVTITEAMTVRDFAEKLGIKAKDLMGVLFERGVMVTINHLLEPELAEEVATEMGVESRIVSFEEEVQLEEELELVTEKEEKGEATPRAPVVTIMGHVDHGKTTLLDTIRSSKITESEFGGITQHIGAYSVEASGKSIVFLDTPGHEAFTLMRARGANATDLVVLVVAADDGVMPQTVEAIDHARAAEVPIIVAINKIDKSNANSDRVKKELADRGLTVEDWGGDVVSVEISALKGDGIPELLEMILLNAELLDLRAHEELSARGVILEACKEPGRGMVATALVQEGTLHPADAFVAGATWGRVRSMNGDVGDTLEAAGPSTPVEVTGFDELPAAGDTFQVVEKESKARSIAQYRREEQRQRELAPSVGKVSLDQLFAQIQEGEVKELPIVIKADVQGSVEVLADTLQKLSTEKVKLQVIHAGVGAITTNDVLFASASGAIIVGFNVRPERNAAELADKEEVDIRLHTVIYELADEITKAMTGLLEPTYREVSTGRAEVREIFKIPKLGMVAGCHVVEGLVPRAAEVRLLRDNVVVYEGKIASLRRFKDDAAEVRTGFDCGIRLERFQDVKPGDLIEAFVQEEVAPTL